MQFAVFFNFHSFNFYYFSTMLKKVTDKSSSLSLNYSKMVHKKIKHFRGAGRQKYWEPLL